MRLPRFTTRRLMALVAFVAIALGARLELRRRMLIYRHLERMHYDLTRKYVEERDFARNAYHWQMFEKYRAAAARPWLPVTPDPPPPE